MNRIEKIKELQLEQPNDQFLWHALALEYMKIGDLKAAENAFLHNLTIDAMYLASYYHLGKVYEQMSDLNKAALYYNLGIDIGLKQDDRHTIHELRSALDLIED